MKINEILNLSFKFIYVLKFISFLNKFLRVIIHLLYLALKIDIFYFRNEYCVKNRRLGTKSSLRKTFNSFKHKHNKKKIIIGRISLKPYIFTISDSLT